MAKTQELIKKYETESTRAGACPNCGSNNLSYNSRETYDDDVEYPYQCDDCDFVGGEVYALVFVGHNIFNEEEQVHILLDGD